MTLKHGKYIGVIFVNGEKARWAIILDTND